MTEVSELTMPPTPHVAALSFDGSWFNAPPERSGQFLPVFFQVSVAVQAALRRAVPALYFSDLQVFRDTRMAYPMLVYAASRPFRGETRTDFTYDILNRALMRRFYVSAGHGLPLLLRDVCERLRAAGMDDVAKNYRPELAPDILIIVDHLKLCRRRLEAMLHSEMVMVDNLTSFAGSRALRPAQRRKLISKCERVWLSRLDRLYARKDFSSVGPGVLAAATDALRAGCAALAAAR
jgi:hypothetical protein